MLRALEFGPETEGPGVMVHMIPHKGGDKVVAVIIQGLHPYLEINWTTVRLE